MRAGDHQDLTCALKKIKEAINFYVNKDMLTWKTERNLVQNTCKRRFFITSYQSHAYINFSWVGFLDIRYEYTGFK